MKKEKRVNLVFTIVIGLVVSLLGFYAQTADADTGFKFQPRINVGWLDYTLDLKSTAGLADIDWNINDNMPVAEIGATLFIKKFYVDFLYQHTAKGYFDISAGNFLPAGPFYELPLDADVSIIGSGDFHHRNYAITLGYQLLDNLSFYAGYKQNDTSFDLNSQTIFHMIDDGSLTGTPGFPINQSLIGDFDIDYEANGPFIGGIYGFIIDDKGVLSLNLAVAFLDGDIKQNGEYINPRTGIYDDLFDMSSSGDSIGLSYGIGWRSNLTDRLGYYLTAKGYNYDFEADNKDQPDFRERTYQFSIGLSYSFH
jgi:hypothetical protein